MAFSAGKFFNTLGGLFPSGESKMGQYADVNQQDFYAPGIQNAVGQRGDLAERLGSFNYGGSQQAGGSRYEGQQWGLAQQLRRQALGQGPSMADLQMRQGIQQGMAGQQALMASGRGNQALGARQASQNVSGLSQQLAMGGVMGRLQEQQNAQGLYGQMLAGARGQDMQRESENAQMRQDYNLKSGELRSSGLLKGYQQQNDLYTQMQQAQEAWQRARTDRAGFSAKVPSAMEQVVALGTGAAKMGAGGAG